METTNNISRRHHYIPITYLKAFCNTDNKMYIYDKLKRKGIDRPLSTKTHFFEWNRNIVNINGIENDEIEKIYRNQDNKLAKILKKINSANNLSETLGVEGFLELKYFLSNLFWRIPSNDLLAEAFLQNIKPSDLPFHYTNLSKDDDLLIKKHMLENKQVRKITKLIALPTLTFSLIDDPHFMDKWNYVYSRPETNWNKHLTCDNPIIYKDINELFNLSDNIIFPISGDKTLLCIKNHDTTRRLGPDVTLQIDLAVFSNAYQYVCSSDKEYLNSIADLYYEIEKIYGLNTHKHIIDQTFSMFIKENA